MAAEAAAAPHERPAAMRRLSMSSDKQWTLQGRAMSTFSGYALSPTMPSNAGVEKPAASLKSPKSSTVNLDAASIFDKLGMSMDAASSPRRVSSTSSLDALPQFDGLQLEDSTPNLAKAGKNSFIGDSGATTPAGPRMTAIGADILLPYADRPAEVKDLLENVDKNRALYEMLKETFVSQASVASPATSPSVANRPQPALGKLDSLKKEHQRQDSVDTITSSNYEEKWSFEDLQAYLAIPRAELGDQEWIDGLKAHVYPRSHLLWERLRACIGVDVDDEQGGDRYEPLSTDMEENDGFNRPEFFPYSPRAVVNSLTGMASPSTSMIPIPALSPAKAPAAIPAYIPNTAEVLSASSSPVKPGASPRRHSRTSSGGSAFRRSFAMSSIDEDKPVNKFDDGSPEDAEATYSSSEASQGSARNPTYIGPMHDQIHSQNLRNLAGDGLLSPSPSSQQLGTSPYGQSSNAFAPGHLPPPAPLTPVTPSASMPSIPGSLGLSNPTGPALERNASNYFSKSTQKKGRDNYDDYTSVFESEETQSLVGRSMGQGPGMRFSFGANDASAPEAKQPRSGFALAGMNLSQKPAQKSMTAAVEYESGRSTPTA